MIKLVVELGGRKCGVSVPVISREPQQARQVDGVM